MPLFECGACVQKSEIFQLSVYFSFLYNFFPFRVQIYQDDVFGLKTLDKNQRLHECTVSKVKHIDWHGNNKTFSECIEPWLT